MKKRILSLVAALALAATVVTPVSAAFDSSKVSSNNYFKNATDNANEDLPTGVTVNKDGLWVSSDGKFVYKDSQKKAVDTVYDYLTDIKTANGDLKPSGAANAKVNVVTGSAKDNLTDNGIKPVIKEFVKATEEGKTDKAHIEDLRGIPMFDLTADASGDVSFKLDDDKYKDALTGDNYAIVLHYTGNAADEDGITAQYCKISSAGKVTAHFNSFSPVAIVATKCTSAQKLVNTYSHSAGSDAGNAAATTTPATVQAPVVDPNAAGAAAPADAAGAAAAANGKGAASPKTSDNAYALYLILAVAAVAGTTLVATKKTR